MCMCMVLLSVLCAGRKLVGQAAPLEHNLKEWLRTHPDYSVLQVSDVTVLCMAALCMTVLCG